MNGLTIPQLAARETTEGDANNNPPAGMRITDDSLEPLTANNSLESLTANDSLEPRAQNHSPEPACFSLAALLVEIRPHPELDQRTPAYHLQQSDATAADGYHHAAINEARSFLESLTVTIVREVRRTADARTETAHEPSSSNATAYRAHRRFLMESGFLDADENELVRYAYSLASAKGSHHGIADEAWTRLTRRVVHAAAHYLLTRYKQWKNNHRPLHNTPTPAKPKSIPAKLRRMIEALGDWRKLRIAWRKREF